ncbi:MAG: glycosyltransferase family 39 protein [Acidobacteriota bacterium]
MESTLPSPAKRLEGTSARPRVVGLLWVLLAGYALTVFAGVHRAGYSIDEEFTYFAVQGISHAGVPVLPSGALENRGLPYTYAAWLSGEIFGHGFPAYRYPSLLSGIVSIALVFRLASMVQSPAIALVTAFATALLPWQILSAEWARFYAMFVACYLWSLLQFHRYRQSGKGLVWWLTSVGLAHLLHEFAITLVLLPAIAELVRTPDGPRPAWPVRITTLAVGAFLASEAVLFALHLLTSAASFRTPEGYAVLHVLPVGWETMSGSATPALPGGSPFPWGPLDSSAALATIGACVVGALAAFLARRVGLAGLPAFAAGALTVLGQFSRAWFLWTLWAFARPAIAVRALMATAGLVTLGALGWSMWTSHSTGAEFSVAFARGFVVFALREATTVYWGLLYYYPATTVLLAVSGIALAVRSKSRPLSFSRIVFMLVLCWLITFDVLRVEFKPRYYVALWPLIVLATLQLPRLLHAGLFSRRCHARWAHLAVAVAITATLAWEYYRADDENRTSTCVFDSVICAPTMVAHDASGVSALARESLRPTDVVLCTDELACLYLVGRVDYWLYSGTIFAHQTGSSRVGLYGGSPILASPSDLQRFFLGHPGAARTWVVVPSIRKYPTWSAEQIGDAMPPALREGMQVVRLADATVIKPVD